MRRFWTALGAALLAGPGEGLAAPAWHALQPGSVVEVELERKGIRYVADEVDVRSFAGDGKLEITAPIEERRPDRIRVLGVDLVLDGDTQWKSEEGVEAEFRIGDWVEIDGILEGRALRARRVKQLAGERSLEVEGPLEEVWRSRRALRVAGIPFEIEDDARVRGAAIEIPRAIDDDDDRPSFLSAYDGRLLFGGRVAGDWEPERNFDLNDRRDGDLVESTWSTELQVDARFTTRWEFFAKAGFRGTRVLEDQEGDEEDEVQRRVQQAWVLWRPTRDLAIQVGRQDFDEDREWLYDENLDAVRVHSRIGRYRAEASVSRRWSTESARLEDWTNTILLLRRAMTPKWDAEVYFLHRHHPDGDRPRWLGLRSRGRLSRRLHHWAELSGLSGRLEEATRNAWAVDVGLRYRLLSRPRLAVTAGWAAGSGDDSLEGIFRQTGLNDNNAKFAGVSSFRYYGALLDPELSNLTVTTIGVGLRPLRHSSVDVVLHGYEQRTRLPALVSSLESRPRGTSADLGSEVDVVVAWEELSRVDVEYVFARFSPGEAFGPDANAATLHQLSVQFGF